MRKVAVLISGNIRIYEKNLHFLKKIFKDFKITIISSVWDHQENIEKFKSLYQIINLKKIKEKNVRHSRFWKRKRETEQTCSRF